MVIRIAVEKQFSYCFCYNSANFFQLQLKLPCVLALEGCSPGVNYSLMYPTDRLFELFSSSVMGGKTWLYGSGHFCPPKNQLSIETEVEKSQQSSGCWGQTIILVSLRGGLAFPSQDRLAALQQKWMLGLPVSSPKHPLPSTHRHVE